MQVTSLYPMQLELSRFLSEYCEQTNQHRAGPKEVDTSVPFPRMMTNYAPEETVPNVPENDLGSGLESAIVS